VAIEGTTVKSGMDIVAEFGHRTGGMISFPVTLTDGTLNIQFIHGIENPLINAIEIRQAIEEQEQNASKFNNNNKAADVISNTEELNAGTNSVIIYPNPASSEVFLTVSNAATVSDIYINDISGRMIRAYKASSLKYGYNQYRLDVSELSNGMYFINLQTNDTVLSTKLIVQK